MPDQCGIGFAHWKMDVLPEIVELIFVFPKPVGSVVLILQIAVTDAQAGFIRQIIAELKES